jgi:protein-disulfide isomerase
MFAIGRRKLFLGASALALLGLSACDGANGQAGANPDDMALGDANAPVTLIEYASVTCSHCRDFHETVWGPLKTNYINTGKVRFVFREFPTPPAQVAVAGFQVARCGGASSEQYFTRVGVLFEQQRAIFASGSMEGVRQKLVEIGAGAGLSEQQVMECITDEAGADRIRRTVEAANRDFEITGTPTLILNGEKLTGADAVTYEGLSRLIDAAIAERG